MLELVNDKRNALVHQVVEIGGGGGGSRAISTIMPICHQKKNAQDFFNQSQQKTLFSLTDIR